MNSKILFLTKYENGASSRYRIYQYLPFLEKKGIKYSVNYLLPANYLSRRYETNKIATIYSSVFTLVQSYIARLSLILRKIKYYDVIFVQYEALPYLPFTVEQKLFSFDRPVVVDYDDAMHLMYEDSRNTLIRRLCGSKIYNIVKRSTHVIVGNRYLAEWAGSLNPNVTLIPTSVDLTKYVVDKSSKSIGTRTVIGWIGTPITAKYMHMLESPLHSLRERHDFVLKVIGAPNLEFKNIDILHVPWCQSTEAQELNKCDIGVMPLFTDRWSYGKSALKLIQYLAAGIVGIASPIGANSDVVQDGQNGLLAENEQQWVEKLAMVIERPELCRMLAEAGRRTVESQYSIQANAPRWIDILTR